MQKIKKIVVFLKNRFIKISFKKRILIAVIAVGILGFGGYRVFSASKQQKTQYQTAQAEKGTLITSISGSGSITSGNNTSITTKVSGVVKSVYITNGDKVAKGQKIAEISLDDYARERQTAAWVKYLEATEAVKEAEKAKVTADIQMWKDQQAVLDAQEAYDNKNKDNTDPATHTGYIASKKMIIDKTLDESRKGFSVSESKYLNADADISYAWAKVAAALRDYQENAPTIVAPASGTISDLMLAPEVILSASSTTSNTSGATIVSAQTIGKISNSSGQLTATITLTEIDIVNVKANQKATLTLDAYPDNTFTGKVLAVNTSGSVSSGVTSYPVTILLDPTTIDIYPNMAVNAQIITNFVTDVILVPSTAISTNNGQSTVQRVKSGKVEVVTVKVGDANDSQMVIVSGINEGDEVVTATITSATNSQTQNNTTSPFSGLGRTTSGSSSRDSGNVRFIERPGGF